ncbi:MAG: hypothetical protein CMI90_00145 [Pelagibacteraceae bacterium]|nr:hypothetical protein [Pelagibacteraceae bacterium]
MNVLLFFTFGVSLEDWKDKGFLDREIKYYNKLYEKNIKFTFITYGDGSDLELINKIDSKIEIIPIFKNFKVKNKFLKFLYSLFFVIKNKKNISKFDYFKTNQNYGSWLAVFASLFNKKKIISRCGYDLFHFSLLKKNPLKIIASYLICFLIYKKSNRIIVPTLYYYNFIKKYFLLKNQNIEVIPNYVDTLIFKDLKYKKNNNKILFVGRLEKQKNILNILNGLRDSNFCLDILGNGSLKDKIITKAKKINTKVNFINKSYTNNEMPTLLNNYNYLILFSLYEGNPKILLEAMSCGLCVIGSDTYGINDIIESEKNGLLFKLSDYNKICNKIETLDFFKLTEIKNNASKFINEKYDFNNVIKKEIKIYN